MILSGDEIYKNIGRDIVIDPFDESRLNPNSYNLSLHDELLTYEEIVLDMRKPNRTRRILVIGTMLAIGRWEEFRMRVRAALTVGGFSTDDIKEIILQQANYCGVPAGNHAFKEAEVVLKELGKLP